MSHHHRHHADCDYLYFITSTIVDWLPIFLSHRYFTILTETFAYCRATKGLRLHAYVLMPNHFHIIASSEPRTALPGIMRDLKRYTSREITRCLEEDKAISRLRLLHEASMFAGRGNDYSVWQEGYHPIAIFTQKFLRQKLDYIHDNPVRKGYVRRCEDWMYSSAWDYVYGDGGVIEIDRVEL